MAKPKQPKNKIKLVGKVNFKKSPPLTVSFIAGAAVSLSSALLLITSGYSFIFALSLACPMFLFSFGVTYLSIQLSRTISHINKKIDEIEVKSINNVVKGVNEKLEEIEPNDIKTMMKDINQSVSLLQVKIKKLDVSKVNQLLTTVDAQLKKVNIENVNANAKALPKLINEISEKVKKVDDKTIDGVLQSLNDVLTNLSTIDFEEINASVRQVNTHVLDKKNLYQLRAILTSLKEKVGQFNVKHINESTKVLPHMLKETTSKIKTVDAKEIQRIIHTINLLISKLSTFEMAHVNGTIQKVNEKILDPKSVQKIQSTVSNIEGITRQINEKSIPNINYGLDIGSKVAKPLAWATGVKKSETDKSKDNQDKIPPVKAKPSKAPIIGLI